MNIKNLLWEEKYRPDLDGIVLPERLKNYFKKIIETKQIPNFLFVGYTGLGKTTLAKIIPLALNAEYLFINASEERGIDVLRERIKDFVNTVSAIPGVPKFVILDDAGNMTASLIEALKGFIEQSNNNARFIFTSNHAKFPEPILGRLTIENFEYDKEEKIYVKKEFFNRIKEMLGKENIEFSEMVIAKLINKLYPNFRKIIITLQKYAFEYNKIDENILLFINDKIKEYYELLKKKDYYKVREWISKNKIDDIFEVLYDDVDKIFMEEDIPEVIILISKFMYESKFLQANEREINLAALSAMLMKAKFKK